MPVHKCEGGWKWGNTGKVYPTKKQAEQQGKAIEAAKTKRSKSK